MTITIFHNPRCSKSRQTLGLIEEKGLTPTIVEYLKDAPTKATLKTLLKELGLKPRDLMRKKEAAYKDLNLADEGKSDDELIEAMIQNPILIERPIVMTPKGARLGRPPESVLEIL